MQFRSQTRTAAMGDARGGEAVQSVAMAIYRHWTPFTPHFTYGSIPMHGGRTTSSHSKPKTQVPYYAAKPVNCLPPRRVSTIDSLSASDRSRSLRILLSYAERTRCYASTIQWRITRVCIFWQARYSHIVPICRGIISGRVHHSIQASSL